MVDHETDVEARAAEMDERIAYEAEELPNRPHYHLLFHLSHALFSGNRYLELCALRAMGVEDFFIIPSLELRQGPVLDSYVRACMGLHIPLDEGPEKRGRNK